MTLEEAENRRRQLASTVKRLRVAAMSDATRTPELADAVSGLTAAALLVGDLAEAATSAPEAVVLAARILAAGGPAGPYASLEDAVRYFGATARLAAVQAGLGHDEAAARTLDGLDAWRGQVGRLPLAGALPDDAVLWMLVARSRASLATDPAAANAWADAAELRLHGTPDVAPFLATAVHLATADARWAAGRPDSALAHSRLALTTYEHATAASRAGARRPAVARAVAAPTPAVYGTYAARLAAIGDRTLAVALLRQQVALLDALSSELVAEARGRLASALLAAGRADEAGPGAAPLVPELPGDRLDWELLPPAATLARVADPGAADPDATDRWRRAEQSASFEQAAARAEAERDEGLLREQALAEAARREAARDAAERRARDDAAAAAEADRRAREAAAAEASERAAREEEAARLAAEQRRRELAEQHRASVDPALAEAAATELDGARAAVRAAEGDAELASAHDRLAGLLRPLAAVNPAYREELVSALEALVGLLWRLGDTEGSRAAAREAKTLGG